uniref:Main capsid protein n=1 Tax=Omono River virus TaxID=753758 RepID=A0ACD6BAF6_9VIRU|nr:main capsid protein [Omono River virus]
MPGYSANYREGPVIVPSGDQVVTSPTSHGRSKGVSSELLTVGGQTYKAIASNEVVKSGQAKGEQKFFDENAKIVLLGTFPFKKDLTKEGVEPNPGPVVSDPYANTIYGPLPTHKEAAINLGEQPSAPVKQRPKRHAVVDRVYKTLTLKNGILVTKVVIAGVATYIVYKVGSEVWSWYAAITKPLLGVQTAVKEEYHTLQHKYDYQWYDYFCPMCLLSKYIANSGVNGTDAEHHNHVMHALNGNIDCDSSVFGNNFNITTSPQTLTMSGPLAPGKYQTTLTVQALIGGTGVVVGTVTFAGKTVAYQVFDDSFASFDLGTVTVSASTTPSVIWTGSTGATLTMAVNIICKPITPTSVAISGQPIWTTPYAPAQAVMTVPAVAKALKNTQRAADLSTRNKTRHGSNNAISVLNQLATQIDVEDQRLPIYKIEGEREGTHEPSFSCQLTFRGMTKSAFGKRTKHEAKTAAASLILEELTRKSNSTWPADAKLTLSGWVRDLTEEGIEPNPGPIANEDGAECWDPEELRMLQAMMAREQQKVLPKMIDDPKLVLDLDEMQQLAPQESCNRTVSVEEYQEHVRHMSNYSGAVGEAFAVVRWYLLNETTNRFAPLVVMDDSMDEPIATPADVSPAKRPSGVARRSDKEEEKPKKPPKKEKIAPAPQPPKTQEQLDEERKFAMQRIADRIKSDPIKLLTWIKRPTSTKFKREVLSLAFDIPHINSKPSLDQYETIVYCYFNDIPDDELTIMLLQYDRKWTSLSTDCKLSILSACNVRASLEAAKAHNKLMHAYNGNPISADFSEVENAPSFLSLAENTDEVLKPYTGLEIQTIITNIVGDANPNQSRIFDQDRLRGNQYSAGGLVTQNAVSAIPFTNLIPRTIRVGNILVNSANRLQITETNVSEYYSNPIIATKLSEMISDQVKNNQFSTWRRDNTSLQGFNAFDIATINTAILPNGLSLESMLLKLSLLHSIKAMNVDAASINRSQYQVIDHNTVPTIGAPAVVGVNNSPVFGEDCGGNNPVYPFGGGTGAIAFHVTLQTVPDERKSYAIFVPPAILQATSDANEALALFALSMSEWPHALYTVTKQTTDLAGANAGQQVFIPTQSTIHIGGRRVLDLIIPRREIAPNPTTLVAANAMCMVRPQAGPDATAGAIPLAAGQLFNMNFIGAPAFEEWPMTSYLYSWAGRFDITTIRQYMGRLATMVGVKDAYWAAHELNVALSQVAPKMTTAAGGWAAQAANSAQQSDVCYSSLLTVTRSAANFPLANQPAADMRVYDTDPATWNKVALGLATAANLVPEQSMDVPFVVGDARASFWERLQAIPMCIAWTMYYHSRGITTLAWDNAYTDNTNKWLQKMVRNTFSTTQSVGTIIPARYGKIVCNLYKNMFHRAPAYVATSVGGKELHITHFERWLPGGTYANVYSGAGAVVNCFSPVLIPDIWCQYFTAKLPLFAGAFPPAQGQNSTKGFNSKQGLMIHRNQNNNLVAPYLEKFADNSSYFPVGQGPEINDMATWNGRLWMTTGNVQYLDYSGAAIVEAVPPAGELPVGKQIPLLAGENAPIELTNAATTCVPRYSNDGRRIFTYLTTAQSVIPVQACNRAANLARSCWLLSNVYAEPALQALGDEVEDAFDTLTNSSFLDVAKSVAESAGEVPATKALTDLQAVDVSSLPSTSDPSNVLSQPAPLMSPPTSSS